MHWKRSADFRQMNGKYKAPTGFGVYPFKTSIVRPQLRSSVRLEQMKASCCSGALHTRKKSFNSPATQSRRATPAIWQHAQWWPSEWCWLPISNSNQIISMLEIHKVRDPNLATHLIIGPLHDLNNNQCKFDDPNNNECKCYGWINYNPISLLLGLFFFTKRRWNPWAIFGEHCLQFDYQSGLIIIHHFHYTSQMSTGDFFLILHTMKTTNI